MNILFAALTTPRMKSFAVTSPRRARIMTRDAASMRLRSASGMNGAPARR